MREGSGGESGGSRNAEGNAMSRCVTIKIRKESRGMGEVVKG